MKVHPKLSRSRFSGRAISVATLPLLLMAVPANAQPNPWRADRPSFVSAPRGPLTLEGFAGLNAGHAQWTSGSATHRIPFRIHEGIGRFELAGLVGNGTPEDGEYARLQGRVLLDFQKRGVWLGGAGRRAYERDVNDSPMFGMGAWFRIGGVICSAALEQTADVIVHRSFLYAADSVFAEIDDRERIRRASLHAGLGWSRGRLALESVAGISMSPIAGPRPWARGSAAVTMLPGLAIVATGGSQIPGLFDVPESNHGQATLGLRLTPDWRPHVSGNQDGSRSWRVSHEAEGWYAIEVRIAGAQTVEITSDATEWAPRMLERIAKDRWRIRLRLDPGVYHVNLRVDGGPWTAPPGAPAVSDDFNGTTGVLVVEK